MQEVSSLQRPSNEVAHSCNELLNSKDLEKPNVDKIYTDMRTVNQEWNDINVKVIERENRSVGRLGFLWKTGFFATILEI